MSELFQQALEIVKEKNTDKKIEKLNKTLNYLVASGAATGVMDITPFIVGCFVASPNDEIGTAKFLRETTLFHQLPQLKDKATFQELLLKHKLKVLVQQGDEVEEITIELNMQKLVDIGREFHKLFRVEDSEDEQSEDEETDDKKKNELSLGKVYQSAKRVIEFI